MKNNYIAVDTNVLIYLHDSSDQRKREIAKNILSDNPIISTQVLSEFINVTRRQIPLNKPEILIYCAELLKDCALTLVSYDILKNAASLILKYNLQIFDSIIVASAIENKCAILFSEDMQHNQRINTLTIINPFL